MITYLLYNLVIGFCEAVYRLFLPKTAPASARGWLLISLFPVAGYGHLLYEKHCLAGYAPLLPERWFIWRSIRHNSWVYIFLSAAVNTPLILFLKYSHTFGWSPIPPDKSGPTDNSDVAAAALVYFFTLIGDSVDNIVSVLHMIIMSPVIYIVTLCFLRVVFIIVPGVIARRIELEYGFTREKARGYWRARHIPQIPASSRQ